ncbi:MAG TPA: hypothetical protein VK153_01850 [Candidatus Paceibacterota bacterium]|nr:hypothetical protein [Candidatus Paceibacterota bacterium]
MHSETRQCNKCKVEFILDQDELSFYEKMKVPVPNVCPDCRFEMRAIWRNEMILYTGQTCGLCGKNIISRYNPKLKYNVYCWKCYFSDKWNPDEYFIDYDLSKYFVDQFGELLNKTPKLSLHISEVEGLIVNSDYINSAGGCKNCYFVFNTSICQESIYSKGIKLCTEVSDIYYALNLDLSYECVNVNKSSGIVFGSNSVGCVDSFFISNCSGLTNCFGCVNLRNKSYCWFNEQLTHDEYKQKLEEILGSYSGIEKAKKDFENFCLKYPHRENNNQKTVDSTGDYLFECKNVKNSFETTNGEDCKYVFSCKGPKDSIDVTGWAVSSQRLLNAVSSAYSSNLIAGLGVENSQNVLYGFYITNCEDCIGCDSISNKKFFILNKQYTKKDYEELKEHIIKELTKDGIYGLMIPTELSPFAYNETIAQDNMPLTKEEALAQGFRWEDDIQITKGRETLQPEEIPDHIKDVQDSITSKILKCISCERNYKIIEQELLFYRKMNLPIPHKCFYCRHHDRIKRRGPYKFWDRKCDHCGKDIKTNYSPDRKEIIYCEHCYQQEVY